MKTTIFYATQKGSTTEIARHITFRMRELKINAEAINVEDQVNFPTSSDGFILLSPIYKSMWLPQMTRFVRKHIDQFNNIPVWVLCPCIRVLEAGGLDYAKENYLHDSLLSNLNVQDVNFIGGKLLKEQITAQDMITLSVRYDGSQLARISGDYRDWNEIDHLTHRIIFGIKRLRALS